MEQNANHINKSERSYLDWMGLQERDLSELLQIINTTEKPPASVMKQMADTVLKHFEDYMNQRNELAHGCASTYYAPSWNSSLENSLLWIAGCRPTSFFRLLFAMCGSEVEAHLQEYLQGVRRGNLAELTQEQLTKINELQLKTIKEEDRLTTDLAGLQEDMADHPISTVFKTTRGANWESNEEFKKAMEEHEKAMVDIMRHADALRLKTLKEVVNVLTPYQAIEYLAAGKKLHLCLHEFGQNKDR